MAGETPHREGPGSGTLAFTADRGDNRVRLDLVLCRHLAGSLAASRTRFQEAIANGCVVVNGEVVTRAAVRVAVGARIEARFTLPAARGRPAPQQMPLDVLFEDEALLAVNKPAGVVVHPCYKHPDMTVLNAVLWHLGRPTLPAGQGSSPADPPRLIHRLDKDTSGVLLVSKTWHAHAAITRAMGAGLVRKEYLAVVCGAPSPPVGKISVALSRDRDDVRRVAVCARSGKDSITRYETLCRGRRVDAASKFSLVRCELLTGRMHQIRVHLAVRGWPIAGDRVYGHQAASPFPRQALHAWRVSLAHPVTGERLLIAAPIPDDLQAAMHEAGLRVPT